MSCIDAAIQELELLQDTLAQRLVWVDGDKAELDQTIHCWVTGLASCADLLETAVRKCETPDSVRLAAEATASYVNIDLPETLAWGEIRALKDAALHLCIDDSNRYHKVEIRWALSENLERLMEAAPGQPELDSVHQYALTLARRLCDGLPEEERIPRFVQEHWNEWQVLLEGQELPLDGPLGRLNSPQAGELLRRFMRRAFLTPSISEMPPNQPLQPDELAAECNDCEHVECMIVADDGRPRLNQSCDVARRLAVNNAGVLSQPPDGPIRHYYDAVIGRNEGLLTQRLYKQQLREDKGWRFAVLQRWNSYTPALGASEGGGYFVYRVPESQKQESTIDVGVVVDPGYGFLKNFFSQGFGVRDISGVVVTHDHPDHLVDFEPMVNLLLEAQKDRAGDGREALRRIDALLSGGAFERLSPSIETTRRVFRDTFVRSPEQADFGDPVEFHDVNDMPINESLRVEPTLAIHKDASELPQRHGYDSIGVRIRVSDSEGEALIAIPSDTQWSNEVAAQYLTPDAHADVVCLHLGAIAKKSSFGLFNYFSPEKTGRDVVHKGWHLYLPGMLWFVEAAAAAVSSTEELRTVLVVLSEFGEELSHGLRADLANRVNRHIRESANDKVPPVAVVPGDVGLVIDPIGRQIRCSCCGHYYRWDVAFRFEVFGDCEQVFYVCPECDSVLAADEKRAIFRQRQAPLSRPVTA